MTSLRDQQREFSARTRDAILVTLQQNGEDWLSSQEIVTALPTIEDLNTWQVGGLLKLMRDQGLVENKAERNFNVWRIKANPDSPRTPYKPADNHPWKEKVCQPRTPRAQPIACELPVHLLTPKPSLEERCPTSLIQECEEAMEDVPAAMKLHENAKSAKSIEDEAPSVTYPAYPPLSQFYIDQIQAEETAIRNHPTEHHGCNGRCRQAGKDQPKPVTTTQPRPLPRLPKDYTARIKVGIYADSDNAFLTIIANDEGAGAFWTMETKGGRLSFDQGEADWLPQLGDGLAQLLDTINGRPLTQPEI